MTAHNFKFGKGDKVEAFFEGKVIACTTSLTRHDSYLVELEIDGRRITQWIDGDTLEPAEDE